LNVFSARGLTLPWRIREATLPLPIPDMKKKDTRDPTFCTTYYLHPALIIMRPVVIEGGSRLSPFYFSFFSFSLLALLFKRIRILTFNTTWASIGSVQGNFKLFIRATSMKTQFTKFTRKIEL
jgi:hypothetical protein